jgi:hypothetical protein
MLDFSSVGRTGSRRVPGHSVVRRDYRLAAATDILRLRRTSGCLGTSRGSLSTTSTTPRVRVPRHIARLVTRLIAPLVIDYFAYAACPGASVPRAARCLAHRVARH